jgi:hypothetical protein
MVWVVAFEMGNILSDNSFSEISSQSWFSRLGGAIKGIFIGLLMFIASFPLIKQRDTHLFLRLSRDSSRVRLIMKCTRSTPL